MTPAEVATKLRQFNEWRREDYAPSEQPEPPNPYEVSLAIDAAVELLEEIEFLRAKIKAMERQEPVAEWIENKFDQYPQLIWDEKYKAVVGTKLYALPGAKGE